MAWAARRGILVKGGRHLETLADVGTVVFDKTGTLTTGRPEVLEIRPCSDRLGADEILALAAATEQRLTHPVAEAIVRAARERGLHVPERESSDYRIGLGVEAMVGGRCVRVGGERFIAEGGIPLGVAGPWLSELNGRAASSLLVAVDGELAGLVMAADPIRTEAPAVVRALRERGVRDIVMLTGDHGPVAHRVARMVGIDSVVADVLPDEKAAVVRRLQAERREVIAVVGDGINDSPALAQADVGIAMRGGADVARETAHVALLDGNLWQIPAAIDISRQAASLIRQNWRLTLWSNSMAIALAVGGVSGPALATLISNGSGVAATLNSLRPLMAGRRVQL
jgi:Cu2+-exporting ATPase